MWNLVEDSIRLNAIAATFLCIFVSWTIPAVADEVGHYRSLRSIVPVDVDDTWFTVTMAAGANPTDVLTAIRTHPDFATASIEVHAEARHMLLVSQRSPNAMLKAGLNDLLTNPQIVHVTPALRTPRGIRLGLTDEVLVDVDGQVNSLALVAALQQYGARVIRPLPWNAGYLVHVGDTTVEHVFSLCAMLETLSGVVSAHPNFLRVVDRRMMMNDPYLDDQWQLHNHGQDGFSDVDIDAPEAWDITVGSHDVIIAVIDD